ncbi:hypothetical protein Taro_002959 [Colocasia esculenta]|uniref:Uncharacterized protein n=1 Tax=Colocasia esculenta TaxID=4460 RepID=A0A843TQD0_COLES|nr:hypothetical protein [Colocasia esculenta]
MEQDLEEPFLPPNAFLRVVWASFPLGYEDHGRSVSTHRQTVSTPLASTVLTASWDSHLVSTHRWTVSTPLRSHLSRPDAEYRSAKAVARKGYRAGTRHQTIAH